MSSTSIKQNYVLLLVVVVVVVVVVVAAVVIWVVWAGRPVLWGETWGLHITSRSCGLWRSL